MSEYRIEEVGRKDFNLLLPLMKDCFGMDVNVDYFRWKYIDNPAGSFLGSIAISKDGEVAAYYGAIRERYAIDGEERTIYQSCDTMTHSRHRRRGLFQLLATHLYEELRSRGELFIIGFGGPESTPGLLKFGWKHVFDVPYWIYPKPFALAHLRGKTPGYEARRVTSGAQIEELVRASSQHGLIHSVKDAVSYDWRTANPLRRHITDAVFDRSGTAVGYVCYYRQPRSIVLFDFHATDREAERALFRHLKGVFLRTTATAIVSFGCPEHAFAQALRRNRFFVNRTGRGPLHVPIPFTFYSTQPELAKWNSADRWHITPFEHDSF